MAESLNKRQLGSVGEDLAAKVYGEMGFRLVNRNLHFGKMGEIDLILEDPAIPLIVFCEVKLRTNPFFAPAIGAVDARKQQRIRKMARCFLMRNSCFKDYFVRFDVCEVLPDEKGQYKVNLFPEAF